MATMNISLPDEMKAYVEEQSANGYAGTSDFVRALIRDEMNRQAAVAELQAIADRAEASGIRTRNREEMKQAVQTTLSVGVE